MPRYFTLTQAERMLREVEPAVREAIGMKSAYETAEEALRDLTRKVMMSGGMVVDQERALRLKQERDRTASRLQGTLDTIQDAGCLVKDLDVGLLDFPTLYHDKEVYLCWRLGETRIEFWHEVESGFRGRRPIDEEFLQNHRGEGVRDKD